MKHSEQSINEVYSNSEVQQKIEQQIVDLEYQTQEAEEKADEAEDKELEAILLAARKKEAEKEEKQHEQNIERVMGE